jgi:TRAP-type C4-dicarboxylate transport system permease small subunit
MSLLYKVDASLARWTDVALIATTAIIATLVSVGVLLRYVFSSPLTWAEEFIVTLFVWSVMLGIPSAVRAHMHLRIDVLILRLNSMGRRVAAFIAVLCTTAILGATLYAGVTQVAGSWSTSTPMLNISSGWTFLALPLSLGLTLLHGLVIWKKASVEAVLQNSTEAVVDAAHS